MRLSIHAQNLAQQGWDGLCSMWNLESYWADTDIQLEDRSPAGPACAFHLLCSLAEMVLPTLLPKADR